MTQVIQIWLDVMDDRIPPQYCILEMGDNTASMGWLRRSNAKENDKSNYEWTMKQDVSQMFSYLVIETDSCLHF